jgi:hypothetical protein
MTIAEFVPEGSVIVQGKAWGTNLTRFDCLQHASRRPMAATDGDIPGGLAWLARQYGKNLSDEIALAVETGVEGSE